MIFWPLKNFQTSSSFFRSIKKIFSIGASVLWLSTHNASANASTIGVNDFLKMVQDSNPAVKAAGLEEEAADLKKELGDLELSPYLSAGFKYFDDERFSVIQMNPPIFGNETKGQYYSLGISKKFSTGTSLQLMVSENPVSVITTLGPQPKIYNGSWTATLSQPLWKNFLGKSTSLRRNREETVAELEKTAARLAALQILANAEAAYWNALYLKQEVLVRKDSLNRAKRLYDWTRRRLNNGISQKADLVQVEALQTTRELQLIGSEDDEKSAQRMLKDFLQQDATSPDLIIADQFNTNRVALLDELKQSKHLRADAYIAKLQAKLQSTVSAEIKEAVKPDLLLEASYSANGLESTLSDSLQAAMKNEHPNKSIGVRLIVDLDFGAKSSLRKSADLSKSAAEYKSAKLEHDSNSEVFEVSRRYQELSRRILSAEQLTKLQKSKYDLERARLENGRSTTFQVVTFEQDAAESELLLYKLYTDQRKIESNARLFIKDSDQTRSAQ